MGSGFAALVSGLVCEGSLRHGRRSSRSEAGMKVRCGGFVGRGG